MKTKPETPTASTPTTTPTSHKYTFDELVALGASYDRELHRILYRGVSETTRLDRGRTIETQDLLDAAPEFFSSVRGIYAGLSEPNRKLLIGYSPDFDLIFAFEVGNLRRTQRAFEAHSSMSAAERARARASLVTAMTEGRILRDQAARAARDFLGESADKEALLATKGTAETWGNLKAGLEAVARFIEDLRKDKDLATLMDRTNMSVSLTGELRAAAADLEKKGQADDAAAPEARVTKRDLDVQDGTVWHIASLIWRAFRDANNKNPAILLPELGAMAPHLESRPRKARGAGGGGAGEGGEGEPKTP